MKNTRARKKSKKSNRLEYLKYIDSILDNRDSPTDQISIKVDNQNPTVDGEIFQNLTNQDQRHDDFQDVRIEPPDLDIEHMQNSSHAVYQPQIYEQTLSSSFSRYAKLFLSRYNLPQASLPSLISGFESVYQAGIDNQELQFPSVNSLVPRDSLFLLNSFKLCNQCDSPLDNSICPTCQVNCSNPSSFSVCDIKKQLCLLYNDSEFIKV